MPTNTAHRRVPHPKPRKRSGVPITVYFDENLNERLKTTSKQRHVDKSAIIRLAVERLLAQLESGQLELPLGI
jgi:predicted DNA-binding protein